jgi:hypothetical protein
MKFLKKSLQYVRQFVTQIHLIKIWYTKLISSVKTINSEGQNSLMYFTLGASKNPNCYIAVFTPRDRVRTLVCRLDINY